MSRFDKFFISFILLLIVSFSFAVIKTAKEIGDIVIENKRERRHQPTECEQYYNDGTDNWKECMGVGYK